MIRRFADNPYYVQYEGLLLDLARLQAEGQADTPILDPIYEAMERIDSFLDQSEIDRLNNLSSDLYMLEGREIREPLDEGMTVDDRNRQQYMAVKARDWERVLELMRMGASPFLPSVLAHLRSTAYGGLGHSAPELVFLRYAVATDPANQGYRCDLMARLLRKSDLSEAVTEAETILSESGASPLLRLQAGFAFVLSAHSSSDGEQTSDLERAVMVIRQALNDADAFGLHDEIFDDAWVTLGQCYALLRRFNDARGAFDKALKVTPGYHKALVGRASIRMASDRKGAIEDFRAAIQAGSQSLAAYLHVAYDALLSRDFDQCRSLSEHILGLQPSNSVREVVDHWISICDSQLGQPVKMAIVHLQETPSTGLVFDDIKADNGSIKSDAATKSSNIESVLYEWDVDRLQESQADLWPHPILQRAA